MSETDRQRRSQREPVGKVCPQNCGCGPAFSRLVQQECEALLAHKAAKDAALWQRSVGLDPLVHAVRKAEIIRQSDASPSFDDFFFLPDEKA